MNHILIWVAAHWPLLALAIPFFFMGMVVEGEGDPEPEPVVSPDPGDPNEPADEPQDEDPDDGTYTPEYDEHGYDQHGYDEHNRDADGNPPPGPLPEREGEQGSPSRAPAAAAAPKGETRPAIPATQRHVYTTDNMYTQAEREMLAQADLDDPGYSQSYRLDRIQAVDRYANDSFDSDQAELEAVGATEAAIVNHYKPRIERERRTLNRTQLQMREINKNIIARLIMQDLTTNPEVLAKAAGVLGITIPGAPASAPPRSGGAPPPATTKRRVIPPAQRMPAARGAAPVPAARRATPTGSFDKVLKQINPSLSDAEVREYNASVSAIQAEGRRR